MTLNFSNNIGRSSPFKHAAIEVGEYPVKVDGTECTSIRILIFQPFKYVMMLVAFARCTS
jgi:hypothetical protein